MRSGRITPFNKLAALLLVCYCTLMTTDAFARMGGAGGHGGGYSGGGSSGSGSGIALLIYFLLEHPFLGLILIAFIVYFKYIKKGSTTGSSTPPAPSQVAQFPQGLDANKIATSFLAIQDAWQRKDPAHVRKWLSDGMYQRITVQFKMMDALGQKNTLSNIRITNIAVVSTITDGQYQVADVAISFTMDDSFTSNKYPQFNENYPSDSDTEYWTFIKHTGSSNEKNLYDNNNCPNCGAPFEVKMGEISRCANCNTLTNSAAYDWVLSEITQNDDFSRRVALTADSELKVTLQKDAFFAVQRMEDIASNIFMQLMDVLTVGSEKRIARFAGHEIVSAVALQKQKVKPFVYDRLYINNVTLSNYAIEGDLVKLYLDVKVTYRRVAIDGQLQIIDNDFVTRLCSMELSRNKNVNNKSGETVYSYECSSCGAPYTDTTEDNCSYCGAPVVDVAMNWVLTGFAWK